MNPIVSAVKGMFGSVVEPVANYLGTRQKIKAAVVERKDALKKQDLDVKLELIKNSSAADLKIDVANGSDPIPWANDLTLILFLIPCVLAFYPPAVPAIKAGFAVIGDLPVEFKYPLTMMLVSVWGYRNLVNPIIKTITTAYLNRFNVGVSNGKSK